jgi:hypothetical protein
MNPLLSVLRRPLLWLALVETLLVAAMALYAWHVWSTRWGPPGAAVQARSAQPPTRPIDRPPRLPATPGVQPSATATPVAGATTGLRTDPDFVARQMNELNRVESTFENLEWRATRAVVDAIQYYAEHVVLPSIERTEKAAQ